MRHREIKNKTIFITGGSGFIGSWLVSSLIHDNEIVCYDNGRRFSPRIKELLNHKNMIFIKGDILDKKRLSKSIPEKPDMVFHLAAIAGVSSYYSIPFETMSVNLIGTYNLLELVKDKKLELFIDFSTSEVYGRDARNVSEEEDTRQGPISDLRWTYSISKLAAEELVHVYYHKYGLPAVSVRPFNIYGPFQIGEGAVDIFISAALKGKTIAIDGDGSQVRAWCYIEDFIDGVFSCVKKRKIVIGNVFNLGNPAASASILDLAEQVVDVCGSGSKIRFRKNARTDVEYRVPDISKAKRMLDFAPSVGLGEGLKRTIVWHRQHKV